MLSASWERMTGVPRRIDRFIAPSFFLRGKLIQGRIDRSRITVIPNFTNLDMTAGSSDGARDEDGGHEGDYFVYTGRLLPEKGIDLLIRAAGSIEGARLLVVGEGPIEEELREEAERYGSGRVEFTGFLGGDDFRRTVAGARFVVLPSRWYENLPFSVMEAMAAGKPVVAYENGGVPEMVADGETGRLCRPGDVEELAQVIIELIRDERQRDRLGEAGRVRARELFSARRHVARMEEALDRAVRTAADR
jgi:glycosyltransferase involved in cell wall biosynthesis